MAEYGPWGASSPSARMPAERQAGGGLWLWLALVVLALGVFGLADLASLGQPRTEDWVDALCVVGLLALIGSGFVFVRRPEIDYRVRHVVLWLVTALTAATVYAFRDDAADVARRVQIALAPQPADARTPGVTVVTESADGHFYVAARMNGQPVRLLVDTGASDILLSPADARRIGVDLAAARFDQASATANGVGYSAALTAASLQVGADRVTDVPVSVSQSPMPFSLLGMDYLRRLDSFEVRGGRMYLRAR